LFRMEIIMRDLTLDGNFLTDNSTGVVYDLTAKVPAITIFYFYVGSVLLLMTIITALILIRKRFKPKFTNILIGIMTYIMFPYLLYSILSMIILMLPGIGDTVGNSNVIKIILNGIMLSAAYVLSVYVPVWLGYERVNAPGEAMYCGLGVAIGVSVIPAISYVYNAAISDYINDVGGVIGALSKEATNAEYYEMASAINGLITESPVCFLFEGFSVLFIAGFTIMGSLVIYGVFNKQIPKVWILLPIFTYGALTVLSDIRRVKLANIQIIFTAEVAVIVAAIYLVYRLQKKYMGHILKRERIEVRDLRKNRKNKFLR